MKSYKLPALSFTLALALSVTLIQTNTTVVTAQDVTTNSCLTQMHQKLLEEDLFYRAVLFGQSSTKDAEVGTVRFDGGGNAWLKTKDDQWESVNDSNIWDDNTLEENMSPRPRRGIFETKKALTSELLPDILQSMRAFQCRLRATCAAISGSTEAVDGCISFAFEPIAACSLESTSLDVSLGSVKVGVCEAAAQAILDRESNELAAVLSYDTSYRTLLQIGGIVSDVSNALRGSITDVLPSMVRAASTFTTLPCFSAQCDQ